MKQHRNIFWLALMALLMLGLACNLSGGTEEVAEATLAPPTEAPSDAPGEATTAPETIVETVVVVATPTLLPTEAPAAADVPVLNAPAPASGDPTVTSLVDLNVRTGPGTNYGVVGALPAGSSAAIVGKSPDGNWWKISCPANVGNECWTSAGASYSTASNAGGVPVANVPPAPTHAPTYTYTPSSTTTATSTYPAGTATALYLTGTPTYTATPPNNATATNTYTPTPTQENGATATNTPTSTYTATPTEAAIAPFDNDSLQNPAVSVFLSITGNRSFTYTDAISYEAGDQDDWVEFELPANSNPNQNIFITLECTFSGNVGNAAGRITLYENGQQTTKIVLCNVGEQTITINNTATYQGRIHFGVTNDGVRMDYTVTVVGFR
ncbi:MAG: SH3 domain-containing protein [Anaerolineales bacterium]|nr:SH3 domain-containing protein [Anaerolineales bacterium]MCB8963158.1 SH3 domain-containing protein [Ardenticatenales bacterium]